MRIKLISAVAAALLLAACSSDDTAKGAGAGTGTSTTGSDNGQVASMAAAPGSAEDFKQNVGDRVFFEFNQSGLRADAKGTLDKQATWLAKYGSVNVQVAGNCDERGTEEYNLALGQRRANAAASYLKAKGVAGARLSTISYGKDRPTAQGSNEQAWAQNRNAITSVR